jgi:hypothetical protein
MGLELQVASTLHERDDEWNRVRMHIESKKKIKGRDYCMLLASKYTLLIISAAAIIATIRVNPSVVMAACPVKSV